MATAQPTLNTVCPVCSEHYTDPKVLPCADRLCRRCLVSWLQQHPGIDYPTCPVCKQTITDTKVSGDTSPESVADQMPSDDMMAALVKCMIALESPGSCSGCSTNASSDFCLQCWEMYCPSCSKLHTNMAVARHHTVSPLSAITPQTLMASRRLMCETHPSRHADVFCTDHKDTMCVTCSCTSHRKCDDIVEVKSAGALTRQAIRDKLVELQKVADTYKQTLRALRRLKLRNGIWYDGEKQRLAVVHQRLWKALEAGIEKTVKDINEAASKEQQEIQNRFDALNQRLCYLENQKTLLEETEAVASDVDIVTKGSVLLEKVACLTVDNEALCDEDPKDYCVASFDRADVSRLEKELREMEIGSFQHWSLEALREKAFPDQEKCRILHLGPGVTAKANAAGTAEVVDCQPFYELKELTRRKWVKMSVCRPGRGSGMMLQSNVEQAQTDLSPGPHAVIWEVPVLLDQYSPAVKTKWESLTVDCYQEARRLFAPFPTDKLIVVFQSYNDDSELDVEEYLSHASQDILGILQEAGGRWLLYVKDTPKKAAELKWCDALTAQMYLVARQSESL